ncbi:hypothetical protein NMY22_g12799 [Coprinellus aureogranulatus]|nr:hypothetical protein NMY22_g12799 [Coprinellus aureogranulatus]
MTPHGYCYWITFIDDHSRYKEVVLLKQKSDAFQAFKDFVVEVGGLQGLRIPEEEGVWLLERESCSPIPPAAAAAAPPNILHPTTTCCFDASLGGLQVCWIAQGDVFVIVIAAAVAVLVAGARRRARDNAMPVGWDDGGVVFTASVCSGWGLRGWRHLSDKREFRGGFGSCPRGKTRDRGCPGRRKGAPRLDGDQLGTIVARRLLLVVAVLAASHRHGGLAKAHMLWRIVSGSQPHPGSKPLPPASTRSPSASTSSDKDTTTVPMSTGDDSKLIELQDAWDAKRDKAAGWIWLMLEQDQKTLVDGCKDDPSAMWRMLQATYRQQKAGSRFNAYDDLLAIRKKEDESLQSLINRVDEAMKLCQSLFLFFF